MAARASTSKAQRRHPHQRPLTALTRATLRFPRKPPFQQPEDGGFSLRQILYLSRACVLRAAPMDFSIDPSRYTSNTAGWM